MMLALLTGLALAQVPSNLFAEAAYVDVDAAAVGSEIPFTVTFTHTGDGPITVSQVDLTNVVGTAFTFEGAPELTVPENGSAELALLYRPTADGLHQAELVIQSNADCTAPQVVTLRGSAYEPCIVAAPKVIDMGVVPDGQTEVVLLTLQSCDGRTHTVDTTFVSNIRFTPAAPPTFDIGPTPTNMSVQFNPIDDSPQGGELLIGSWETAVQLTANDCYNGNPDNFDSNNDGISDCGIPSGGQWADADGDGFSVNEGDCNDTDAAIFPGATEVDGGQDDNCDGRVDEHTDRDMDSSRVPDDCDDSNPWMAVGEPEVADGLDNDCDGEIDESVAAEACDTEGGGADAEKGCGCATGGSVPVSGLLLVGLVGLRRRRS